MYHSVLEYHRVIGGRIHLGFKNFGNKIDGIVSDAMNLWSTSKGIGILYALTVGVANVNSRRKSVRMEKLQNCCGRFLLARMRASLVNLGNKCFLSPYELIA